MAQRQPGTPIKVLVVDDHEVVRQGLCDYLAGKDGFEVVAQASSADAALSLLKKLLPDVALLDVRLGESDGIALCRQITQEHPSVRCLMLTSFGEEDVMLDAIAAGAVGFMLKAQRLDHFLIAMEKVAGGERIFDPSIVAKALSRLQHRRAPDELASLTSQERKIFDLMALGATNRQIAAELFLAEQTVKNYVSRVLMKVGLERRAQSGALAADIQGRRRRNE